MNDMQKRVQAVRLDLGLKTDPIVRLLTVMEELGELTKAILKSSRYDVSDIHAHHIMNGEIEGEIGDVLFDLLLFTNLMGVDADQALSKTIEKMTKRFAEKGHPGSRE